MAVLADLQRQRRTRSRRAPAVPGTPDRFGPRHWTLLAVVTLLGTVLRLWGLGEWSFWIDEAHTWRDATMALGGENGFLRSDRVFYPLAPTLLRFLIGVGWIGYDEGALRLPFAVFGIGTLPLVALAGRRLVGAWPAVLAAALLAVHPWHIYWSQNVRGYVLVMLATVVAANRAHAWLVSDRPIDLIAAGLAVALGCLSHPSAALLVAGFAGFLCLRRSQTASSHRRLLVVVVAGLAVLWVGLPWLFELYSPFQGFLRSKDDPSIAHFVQTTAYYFRPTALLLASLGLCFAMRALDRDRALLLACLWIVPFLALLGVGGQLVKVTARYAICTLPVMTWLVALACSEVARAVSDAAGAGGRLPRAVAAVLLPLFVCGDYLQLDAAYYGIQHGQRARWREATELVRQHAGDRALRVVTISHPTVAYYLRRRHWFVTEQDPHPRVAVLPLIDWMVQQGVTELKEPVHDPGGDAYLAWHRRQAGRSNALLAVLVTLPELAEQDHDGSIAAGLQRDFELLDYLPCWVGPKDESVYVYVPR